MSGERQQLITRHFTPPPKPVLDENPKRSKRSPARVEYAKVEAT